MKAHLANYAVQAGAAVTSLGYGQVAVAIAVIGSVTALVIAGNLDSSAAVALYSAVLGYVFGRTVNNVAANPTEG